MDIREIKRAVMKRAHEIARGMVGPYRARMSVALRQAWKEAKAVKELKLSDLPPLRGTEKQVKWAEDIRREVVRVLNECRKVAEQAAERNKAKLEKGYDRLVESIRGTVHASLVIDRFRWILKQEKMTDKINTIGKGIPMELHNPFLVYAWNHFRKS